MHNWITNLERANKAATKRRQHKKNRIQKKKTLTIGEEVDILAQKEADQLSEVRPLLSSVDTLQFIRTSWSPMEPCRIL
jgi:hypothetical protein